MDVFLESKNIYNGKKGQDNRFEKVDTAYLFTNEIINGYMPDLNDQNVLSVAGCGDHYFNALLNNASKVDLFDINYISKFIILLKKAGFQYLDYDVFCIFFGLYSIYHIFDYDIYQKISKYLDDDTARYWNYLYKLAKNRGHSIYESDIICDFHYNTEEIIAANNYFSEESFLRLRKILSEIPDISFIHADINDLPNLIRGKYDSMFLSNIGTYQNNTSFIKLVKKLAKYLNENGEIFFAYIYGNSSEKSSFYNKLLNSSHYRMEMIDTPLERCQKHKVYIYQK